MAHYVFLDENNVVTELITGRDEDDLLEGVSSWEEYYGELRGQRCLRTSYNTRAGQHLSGGEPFRGNYAGPGMIYREDLDAFINPQPYPSWGLNEETFTWQAPVPVPEEDARYTWDEDNQEWIPFVKPGQE